MPKINLDGSESNFEKNLIPEDTYIAEVTEISDVTAFPSYENKSVMEDKIIFTWLVHREGEPSVIIPQFLKNIITKGDGGKYSNSNLYEQLDNAGYMDAFVAQKDELADDTKFVGWLRKSFIDDKPRFKVMVRTAGKTKQPYTIIDKIIKRVDKV